MPVDTGHGRSLPAPQGHQVNGLNAAWLAEHLETCFGDRDAEALLRLVTRDIFPGRAAVVSSFGAESAVILDLVARVDRRLPVIFLETGKHFPETLAYRDRLVRDLGLENIQSVTPEPAALRSDDPDGRLWAADPDLCCRLRKVEPLARALSGFDAWITGRKRFHGGARSDLPVFEAVDGRIKVNPVARWTQDDIVAAFKARDLPRHPLVADGYRSIGCQPCTHRTTEGEAVRAGRWAGLAKTECGIHKAAWATKPQTG